MDYMLELFSVFSHNEEIKRQFFVVFVTAAVFALGISLALIVSSFSGPLQKRLKKLAVKPQEPTDLSKPGQSKLWRKFNNSFNNAVIEKISGYAVPVDIAEVSKIEKKLIHAGFRQEYSLRIFYSIKTLLTLVVGFVALLITQWFPQLSSSQVLLYVLGGAYFGMIVPNMALDYLEKQRIKKVRHAFPDALDMLVICVEAGLSLPGAIQRVSRDLGISHPELAWEFETVSAEMRLGVERMKALKNLSARTGLDEIRGLVSLMDQAARFGTSMAETLRVYSEEFRDKRTQLAEEAAAKIGTKLIFPLTFCLWPGFFLVAVGPALLKVFEVFK